MRLHLDWGIVLYYVGVPAHCRGVELDEICGSFRPTPFCDSVMMHLRHSSCEQLWFQQDVVLEALSHMLNGRSAPFSVPDCTKPLLHMGLVC